ncbi:MAG: GNAT family N-acetyltransferase [Phycisphaerales bacterium]
MTIWQTTPPPPRTDDEDAGGWVVRVSPDTLHAAAARLVATGARVEPAAADRFLDYACSSAISLEHFFAYQLPSGEFVAAALAIPNPGRTAMLFINRPIGRDGKRRTCATVLAVLQSIAALRLRVAQALLEPRSRAVLGVYEQAGFHQLANLSYLQRPISANTAERMPALPEDVSLISWNDASRDAFIGTLACSYVDTLDCPGLNGVREPGDILAGHRATGLFSPELWQLLMVGDALVGILLMNRSAHDAGVELIYLGLIPSARGRGLGTLLLNHALASAARVGADRVSLAVDDANHPATRLYFASGFRRILRRVAMMCVLPEAQL